MTEVRQLDQVERGVEEALRIFAGKTENRAIPAPHTIAVERIDKIGNMSGLAIVEACETTAKDIEQAGQAAMDVAADILRESRQLAASKGECEDIRRAPERLRRACSQGKHRNAQHACGST
jgi:hypothetical protein